MHESPEYSGDDCANCRKDATEQHIADELADMADEGVTATWEFTNKAGRKFCSTNCRMAYQIAEGSPRAALVDLWKALGDLIDIPTAAWFALEQAGVSAIPMSRDEDGKYHFCSLDQFRTAVGSVMDEMAEEQPSWDEEPKPAPTRAAIAA